MRAHGGGGGGRGDSDTRAGKRVARAAAQAQPAHDRVAAARDGPDRAAERVCVRGADAARGCGGDGGGGAEVRFAGDDALPGAAREEGADGAEPLDLFLFARRAQQQRALRGDDLEGVRACAVCIFGRCRCQRRGRGRGRCDAGVAPVGGKLVLERIDDQRQRDLTVRLRVLFKRRGIGAPKACSRQCPRSLFANPTPAPECTRTI